MTVEQMRDAVRLSDRIAKLEAARIRSGKSEVVRITPFVWDGKGSLEDLSVPGKSIAALYRAEVRRLKEEVKTLTGAEA